jgi:nitrous oxidase accessory protein NosD
MSDVKQKAERSRRTILKTIAASGVSLAGLTGLSSAKPGNRGRGRRRCDIVVPADEPTIQAGVDAASAGETVCVTTAGSPYTEQVVINKDLSLVGVDSPTVTPPGSPDAFTIPESGPSWEPILFAFGGVESGGSVSGSTVVDVDITGFTIDGGGTQPDARRKPGILYRNAVGAVSNNTVANLGVGGKQTFGILAYGNSEVAIWNNTIREYERGGIGCVGDGGTHPSPTADIRGNSVTGSTGIGEAWGPNGIQIGYGADGTITGNEVTDNRYADEAFTASGIIVFESDDVQIRRNTVTNSDVGIAVGSWGWFRPTAANTKVMQNSVREANAGVLLRAVSYPGFSDVDASVSNSKVINNTVSDPDPTDIDTGIAVQLIDLSPNYDPVVENNKVIRNSVTGFETQVDEGGTGTKIHAIEP